MGFLIMHLRMDISHKVRALLGLRKWTQVKLADHLGVSQSTVFRWKEGSEPEGQHRDAIRDLFAREFPDEVDGASTEVPLKGRVGAGQEIYAIDDGGDSYVSAPADAKRDTVAVEVSGESMFPAYEAGTLLYYSRHLPPAEMVNRRAVVQLADGRIFVKIIRPGSTPHTWTLQSINSQYADMVDEVVEWVAPIDWIRPR